jgi:photosystem II stability/assembly factor-like uncharacterized protein
MSAIVLDPLIAEAKRRARRRRFLAFFAAVLVVAALVAITITVESRGGFGGGDQTATPPVAQVPVSEFGRTELKGGGRVIWVKSTKGVWLSVDGAQTWRRTAVPGLKKAEAWFNGFSFVDRAHGWAVVDLKNRVEVARTSDGGRSWRTSYLPAGGTGLNAHLQTRLRGYVNLQVGNGPGHLGYERFASTDGGATWARVARSTLLRRRHAVRAYVPGAPTYGDQIGALERTDDYGRHWTRIRLPGNPDIKELTSSGQRLVAVALVFPANRAYQLAIYASHDGGRHWTQRLAPLKIQPGGPQDACCFYAYAPTVGAVYALSGSKVYVTHDAGRTWHGFSPQGLFPLAYGPIDFVTARVGLAIRGNQYTVGVLVRTTDGGHHWVPAGPRAPKSGKRG